MEYKTKPLGSPVFYGILLAYMVYMLAFWGEPGGGGWGPDPNLSPRQAQDG